LVNIFVYVFQMLTETKLNIIINKHISIILINIFVNLLQMLADTKCLCFSLIGYSRPSVAYTKIINLETLEIIARKF